MNKLLWLKTQSILSEKFVSHSHPRYEWRGINAQNKKMKKTTVFDVLVVYTDGVATSASSKKINSELPFSRKSKRTNYNDAYAYFLQTCSKNNIKAAFTTSKDLTSDNHFKSYWIYKNKVWKKIENNCSALLIFDKFSPINKIQKERRISLFSDSTIKPFNNPELFSLFFDKQKTYDELTEFGIPTVFIKNKSHKDIIDALGKLSLLLNTHPNRSDFSSEFVLKDRYGAGGSSIYKVASTGRVSKISEILENDSKKSFILQPFTIFDGGSKYHKFKGLVDVRVIFMGNKIIQAYIRTAKENDFRCNEHLGGSLEYIDIKKIPRKIMAMAQKISELVCKNKSLYALDFVVTNNGNVYLMEGNTSPGIDWNLSLRRNELKSKKLIREIVKELLSRIISPNFIPGISLNTIIPIGIPVQAV